MRQSKSRSGALDPSFMTGNLSPMGFCNAHVSILYACSSPHVACVWEFFFHQDGTLQETCYWPGPNLIFRSDLFTYNKHLILGCQGSELLVIISHSANFLLR